MLVPFQQLNASIMNQLFLCQSYILVNSCQQTRCQSIIFWNIFQNTKHKEQINKRTQLSSVKGYNNNNNNKRKHVHGRSTTALFSTNATTAPAKRR